MEEESLDLIYEEEQCSDEDVEFELALIARALYRMTEKTHRSFNIDTLYSEPEGRVSVRVDIFMDRKELLNAGCDSHESWNHISRCAYNDEDYHYKGMMQEVRNLEESILAKYKK